MPAVVVDQLEYRYGERTALAGVSFDVAAGEIFGLLGPNGSGKTTLFRILSTLLPVQSGRVELGGHDVAKDPDAVRRLIGVTFQSPSLDVKLTVRENLVHQGHLYGLSGRALKQRCDEVLARMGVADREKEFAEKLSGGLKRRVEIAKCLLHAPQILLLDEPSTGLDPGARYELWKTLESLQREQGVTILVTTHLMEEAERCTRLAILDVGKLIALGKPDELREMVGGDSLTIQTDNPDVLARSLEERFGVKTNRFGPSIRIERERGHELLTEIATQYPGEFRSLTLGKPTLEDVFIKLTGRALETVEPEPAGKKKRKH
ncbi:ABC transporter ATP-binding protein [Planctomicrobium piriforme]|uniref:ABC-2 type transport system ATP-binding protein n=1 Tax=Planctomicrobium piriforme TaxID=1576369 RepID=A0A1I3CZL5_9PLAN|nr:ABC transporter ATP-binding protein [Planctomicrobium piriforme]SFH79671.1 ABC-2 type transport system ATP-binding protein [Planctomicrobium piriforme]